MRLESKIALRYLVSKKKSNAINIISIIAIVGVAVGTCSSLLVSSVFNGFEELIMEMFDRLNPDIKISPESGKRMLNDDNLRKDILAIEGVTAICSTIDEVAFFEYDDKRDVGRLKGVDEAFPEVIKTDDFLKEGKFQTSVNGRATAFISSALSKKLQVSYRNMFEPLQVYMKREKKASALSKPFSRWALMPVGRFDLSDEENQKMVITNLEHAQDILGEPGRISAYEMGLADDVEMNQVKTELSSLLGDGYQIQDRFEQQSSFLKLMNIEKWVGFAIVTLALLLISFNMVGAMWMIILEKEADIGILKSVGMSDKNTRLIFLLQGVFLSICGLVLGLIFGLIFYYIQKEHGLVALDPNLPMDSYPISWRWTDFIPIACVVIILGFLASLPAANRSYRLKALVSNR